MIEYLFVIEMGPKICFRKGGERLSAQNWFIHSYLVAKRYLQRVHLPQRSWPFGLHDLDQRGQTCLACASLQFSWLLVQISSCRRGEVNLVLLGPSSSYLFCCTKKHLLSIFSGAVQKNAIFQLEKHMTCYQKHRGVKGRRRNVHAHYTSTPPSYFGNIFKYWRVTAKWIHSNIAH